MLQFIQKNFFFILYVKKKNSQNNSQNNQCASFAKIKTIWKF